jgi:hypothetical protein
VPVKNDYVKKNPEIQKDAGEPLSIHFCISFKRSTKSFIQDPNGFKDGYDTWEGIEDKVVIFVN